MDNQKYQQLEDQYNKTVDKQERINLLIRMAREKRDSEPEVALYMAEQIIQESEEIDYMKGVGEGLNHKGGCYWVMGEYEEALDQLSEAYAIAQESKDKELEAKILNNFGRIYRSLGDLTHALRDFEAALAINEEEDNVFNKTISLSNISNLYYDLEDYDTALEYALKCLPIFEKDNDPNRLFGIYSTLGDIYFKQGRFDKALSYFQKNLNFSEEGTTNRFLTNSGLGKVYCKLGELDKAYNFLKSVLDKGDKVNNPESAIVAQYYTGQVLMQQTKPSEAIVHFKKAYEIAHRAMRKRDLLNIHESLSAAYEELGNIPKAFDHLRMYEKLRDEIFRQSTFNKLRNLQLKNQMEVARKEKEVAERTARLKQQFMANMSHEIRTPMNAIVGITRLLLEKNPKPEQLRYLEAIKQASDNLLVIINDILDISKIEAGKIEIEKIDFSLRKLFKSMEEIMIIKSRQKDLEFIVEVDKDVPDLLIGDPTRLNQVLINLVSNAIKFTETGHVRVTAVKESRKDNKGFNLLLSVEDTGIGISKQYVKTIFESFTQAGTDTARKYGGTGLGLTISKQLVTLMGGKIEVNSILGEGTTFTVVIPMAIAENQKDQTENEEKTEDLIEKLKGLSILLVEDNEFNQLVAEDTLNNLLQDLKLTKAINGEEAIKLLKTEDFDVILMDIQMPVMNGVEATKIIRKEFTGTKRDTPIIAMTANVLKEDVKRYLDAGMNAYISKPFQTDDLLQKINLVRSGNKTMNPAQQTQKPEKPRFNLPEKVTDMRFLDQFTGGKRDKNCKYIRMFLDNYPKLLKQIEENLETENFEAVKIAAHSMKPQLSYMGVSEEVSNILLIEQSAATGTHRDRLPLWVGHLKKVCQRASEELTKYLQD